MKFEDSKYFKELKHFKLEMPFGNYYLFEHFFVSELNEGVHFDWEKVKLVAKELIAFYGENPRLVFIANRVNGYSVEPQNWIRVEKEYNIMFASAIVVYNTPSYLNASLEKHFSKNSIKRCRSIKEAIDWSNNLKEFD
ncbi:MAG: hypothetical protein ABJL44_14865 [Algibacter sp.]